MTFFKIRSLQSEIKQNQRNLLEAQKVGIEAAIT